jgi:hypothetical protein
MAEGLEVEKGVAGAGRDDPARKGPACDEAVEELIDLGEGRSGMA